MKKNDISPENNTSSSSPILPLVWEKGQLRILDQRKLPRQVSWITAGGYQEVAEAIRAMAVRGAPAIGIAGAWGVVLAAQEFLAANRNPAAFEAALAELADARPTAVNLRWAIERLRPLASGNDPVAALEQEATRIAAEDIEMNRSMAALGAARLLPGARIFTHCNTGALATGGIGTALGVIVQAGQEGKLASVHFTETRPWMQGARLTGWELSQAGIPATLITEGAAAQHMRQHGIDWLIVGADRIAANGDVANKIGTLTLAILARQAGGKVMVVAPTSTVDMQVESGEKIAIENRPAEEVLQAAGLAEPLPEPLRGISVSNPAFDITPADLVDLIVTNRGVVERPDTVRMQQLFDMNPA